MKEIKLAQNDYGIALDFTLLTAAGAVFPLTGGYTVKLKVWESGTPSSLVLDGTCTIIEASAGTCRYTVLEDDFENTGEFEAEIEVTKEGFRESFEVFSLIVTESG
jgi:hypothetical protein